MSKLTNEDLDFVLEYTASLYEENIKYAKMDNGAEFMFASGVFMGIISALFCLEEVEKIKIEKEVFNKLTDIIYQGLKIQQKNPKKSLMAYLLQHPKILTTWAALREKGKSNTIVN